MQKKYSWKLFLFHLLLLVILLLSSGSLRQSFGSSVEPMVDTSSFSKDTQTILTNEKTDSNPTKFITDDTTTNQMFDTVKLGSVGDLNPEDIFISGDIAYVACGRGGVALVNISIPHDLSIINSFNYFKETTRVLVQNATLFVLNPLNGVYLVNVTDPHSPELLSWYYSGEYYNNFIVQDDLLYIVHSVGFIALNISDPSHPYAVCNHPLGTSHSIRDMSIKESIGYFVSSEQFFAVDLSSLSNIKILGSISGFYPLYLEVRGSVAYVSCSDSFLTIDISNPNIFFILDTYDAQSNSDPFLQGDYAYVCQEQRVSALDISNPTDISRTSYYYGDFGNQALFIIDNLVFAVNPANGELLVITFEQLILPELVQAFSLGRLTTFDFILGDDNFVYLDSINGIYSINYTNPNSPEIIDFFDYHHYSFSIDLDGGILAIADFDEQIVLVNITSPNDLSLLAVYDSPNAQCVAVENSLCYISNTSNVIKIVNISDPLHPIIVANFTIPGVQTIENFVIHNSLGYLSAGSDGLYVVNFTNSYSPIVLGNLPTSTYTADIVLARSLALISDHYTLTLVNVTNPSAPEEVTSMTFEYYFTSYVFNGSLFQIEGQSVMYSFTADFQSYVCAYLPNSLYITAVELSNKYLFCAYALYGFQIFSLEHDHTGPTFIGSRCEPFPVRENNVIYFYAFFEDVSGISEVRCFFRIDGGDWVNRTLSNPISSFKYDGFYEPLRAFSNGSFVEYYFVASDNSVNSYTTIALNNGYYFFFNVLEKLPVTRKSPLPIFSFFPLASICFSFLIFRKRRKKS